MKDSFLLGGIRKNKFVYISDAIFDTFVSFSKKHPDVIPMQQVLEKMMIMDFVLPLLKASPKDSQVLEIGCGSGIHSALLSHFGKVSTTELKNTVQWLGDAVDKNRKCIFDVLATSAIDLRFNDGTTIPFENESFDLVFHNSVIEHVPDVNVFNQEVRRVLKAGGICICVTGTPALCRFRFIKYYLFRLPFIFIYGLLTVALNSFLSRTALMKAAYSRIRVWHFQPTHARLQQILDRSYDGKDAASSLTKNAITSLYPSLRHFVREPDYNCILLERLATLSGVSPRSLLLQLIHHFQTPWNDLRFRITPSTHNQHTQNYQTEIREWRVENWKKTFTDSHFRVQTVCGYRYQHIFEAMYSDNFNSWIAYNALPVVRKMSRMLPSWFASEIIIVAEKNKDV
jgi:SAM-dependent methyltransferase